jgi:D-erythronate 2-dehydrogenase
MHIVITGGSGFVGARLARTLLAQGRLALNGASAQEIEQVTLTDQASPPDDLNADARVRFVAGDLNNLLNSGQLLTADVSSST